MSGLELATDRSYSVPPGEPTDSFNRPGLISQCTAAIMPR